MKQANRSIASKTEVLETLSRIIRAQDTDGKYQSAVCRAAELLGKYYGLFDGVESLGEDAKAVIVDDVGGGIHA